MSNPKLTTAFEGAVAEEPTSRTKLFVIGDERARIIDLIKAEDAVAAVDRILEKGNDYRACASRIGRSKEHDLWLVETAICFGAMGDLYRILYLWEFDMKKPLKLGSFAVWPGHTKDYEFEKYQYGIGQFIVLCQAGFDGRLNEAEKDWIDKFAQTYRMPIPSKRPSGIIPEIKRQKGASKMLGIEEFTKLKEEWDL